MAFILTNSSTAGGSGFVDLADPGSGSIATDDMFVKINENAKFAAVRHETIFMGFYKNGDIIPTPISPVDGYAYSRSELEFEWVPYSTRGADAHFVSGQATPPGIGNGLKTGQPANIYWTEFDITDATGKVSTIVSYFSQGAVPENISNDGVVKVWAACQRASVNVSN